MAVEVQTTVCGGFPVLVSAEYEGADRDIGQVAGWVDVCVMTTNGRRAGFIEQKMTSRDWDHVYRALDQHEEDLAENRALSRRDYDA